MDSDIRDALAPDPEGEFPFDPSIYVFHLAVAVARTRDTQLERVLKPVGVNLARHRALIVILRFGPCTMTELAEYSVVDRTTLTRTIDQLVKDGHVDRGAKPEDRRQVVLSLTPAGREIAAKARDAVAAHNRATLAAVPEADVRAMVRAQQAILTNLVTDPDMRMRLLTLQPTSQRKED